jgi:phosphocarrier protein HPr
MATLKRDVTVQNETGMHLRPAAQFVQTANRHKLAEVFVTKEGQRVNGKSIMGLVMLAAAKGSILCIECNGDDFAAQAALDELSGLVESGFGAE